MLRFLVVLILIVGGFLQTPAIARAKHAPPPAAAASETAKILPNQSASAASAPITHSDDGPTIETEGQFAYMVDLTNNTVLLDKNADTRMVPSSMTKMMTSYIVFDKLKHGDLKMEDELTVSEKAWRTGGSKMFVELGAKIKVADLVRGMIISSGNDACVVLAEGIAGSEEAFSDLMNEQGKKFELKDTHFVNSNGWPDPDHYTTAHDLAIIAEHIIADFPEYYPIFGEKEFVYHGIKQGNRNPLLYEDSTADGLKTGHTDEGGYGLTGTAVRGGRRIILVVNGLPSLKARSQETARLMDWGFREFNSYALFKTGEQVDQADVWLGKQPTVPLTAGKDLVVTMPRRARREMKVTVKYQKPIAAPIKAGATVGELVITAPGIEAISLPLVAGASVDKIGSFGRVGAAASYLLFGRGS